VVTSKRVGGVQERGGANANKHTHDRDCADLSARGGHFSKCQKVGS
jgi:hypothetical protein